MSVQEINLLSSLDRNLTLICLHRHLPLLHQAFFPSNPLYLPLSGFLFYPSILLPVVIFTVSFLWFESQDALSLSAEPIIPLPPASVVYLDPSIDQSSPQLNTHTHTQSTT